MTRRSAFLSCIALLAASGMSAPAAAQYVPDQVILAVDQAKLESVVKSLGHTVQDIGIDGKVAMNAQTEDCLLYSLTGTACDVNGVPGCQGLMIQVQYEMPDTASYDTVAQANLEQAAINTWIDPTNGAVGFIRYVVLDYGITMANLRENILILLAIAPVALATVSGEQE
jgi:hypothetical protein